MNLKDYTRCDFCRTIALKTETTELSRSRTICDDCKKTYEEKDDVDITTDQYNNLDFGTYDYDGVIKLGTLCTVDNVVEVLVHEMLHHVLKTCIGMRECSMWDAVSGGGVIEKEILVVNKLVRFKTT